jgi:hypothetical protein
MSNNQPDQRYDIALIALGCLITAALLFMFLFCAGCKATSYEQVKPDGSRITASDRRLLMQSHGEITIETNGVIHIKAASATQTDLLNEALKKIPTP